MDMGAPGVVLYDVVVVLFVAMLLFEMNIIMSLFRDAEELRSRFETGYSTRRVLLP